MKPSLFVPVPVQAREIVIRARRRRVAGTARKALLLSGTGQRSAPGGGMADATALGAVAAGVQVRVLSPALTYCDGRRLR